jgi:hypothetical protein
LSGLVLLTLTPRCGSLHLWGCEVIGRPLVFALGRVIDVARCALRLVINVALSVTLTPARAASKSMPAPTLRCATGNNRPGCKGPRPVSRRTRRDALAEWVRGLEAEARELDAARAEDSKWLCGEARACEGHAAEVFEAPLKRLREALEDGRITVPQFVQLSCNVQPKPASGLWPCEYVPLSSSACPTPPAKNIDLSGLRGRGRYRLTTVSRRR